MPRYVKKATAAKRYQTSGRRTLRRLFAWVDPYPEIHGTLPEKMVYAELSRLGIPFLYLNDLRFKIPEIKFDKYYQADFVIPSIKTIIEVQGAYWHSKPKTIQADAFKFAVYEMKGWHVIAWWDFDIVTRLHDLIVKEPKLLQIAKPTGAHPGKSRELPVKRRTKVDSSKGIRTLNARRRTSGFAKRKVNTVRKSRSLYATR